MSEHRAARIPGKEFGFTRNDFDYLRTIASRQTGIVLSDDKFNMVYSRLARRIRSLKLDSFAAYCDYLGENEESEVVELVNALTTNLTSFFRERHHFEYLRTQWIPTLLRRTGQDRRIRVWSAGCSTGEEPYSIAITLAESLPDLPLWDVKILATDIDSSVVATAAAGVYDEQSTGPLARQQLLRWFEPAAEVPGGVRVSPALRALVQFKQANLVDAWRHAEPFDAVFCRNVIIYFDPATKKAVVERFARYMRADGRLFLGHSESLYGVAALYRSLGSTVYARLPCATKATIAAVDTEG